jgi:hypothetical protein
MDTNRPEEHCVKKGLEIMESLSEDYTIAEQLKISTTLIIFLADAFQISEENFKKLTDEMFNSYRDFFAVYRKNVERDEKND